MSPSFRRWQPAINLVSASTLADVWERHVLDCLQLVDVQQAARWVDIGSGAGLPGLIVAATDLAPLVTVVESDSRKCAFLRSAARRMAVNVRVIEARIEDALMMDDLVAEVVTARALAPLSVLLGYAQPILDKGAVGLFPKGRSYAAELTAARESWTFSADVIPSRTDPDGRILRVTGLAATRERPGDQA